MCWALLLAGWGAHRLASGLSLPSRVAAASFAVWNPYVVERLALGQWALLLAYGALFFVALGALGWRGRNGERDRPLAPWSTWAWVGLASLTPTGGLMATAVAVALSTRRRARVAVGCLLLQLPWVLPSALSRGAGVSDAGGVEAFRAQPDAPGGVLVSVLGLGGIWDLDSVPTSRTSVLGVAAAVVVVVSVLGAWRRLPVGVGPLVPLALGGLVLAVGASVPGLDDLLRWVVTRVPGGGLLRDSQKWLAPLAVLASLSLGVSLDRLRDWLLVRGWAMTAVVAVVGVSTPFLLLPDAASRTWDAVRPVTYPTDFSSVRDRLAASPDHGRMVLLPWRAYRRFDWGNGRSAHDPAYAWFDVSMVGSDELVVGRRSVGDDYPATEEVRRAALAGDDAAARLAALGVGWALLYTDDPQTPNVRLPGLERVAGGPRGAALPGARTGQDTRIGVGLGPGRAHRARPARACFLDGRLRPRAPTPVRWYCSTRRQTKVQERGQLVGFRTRGEDGASLLTGLVAPAAAGGLLALVATYGLVFSQTSAPSSNPAEKPIITYGTN